MNKKGFTLVELLAVIVLIGVLLTIATLSVIGVMNNSKKDVGDFTENQIKEAATTYALENPGTCTSNCVWKGTEIITNLKKYYSEIESKCTFTNATLTIKDKVDDIDVDMSGIECEG